jgi:hypothetical protein
MDMTVFLATQYSGITKPKGSFEELLEQFFYIWKNITIKEIIRTIAKTSICTKSR